MSHGLFGRIRRYGIWWRESNYFIDRIILFAVSTLFSLVILSVEFDAPARALKWLDNANLITDIEHIKVKDALNWAVLTYVIAALSLIAMLLYYIMIYTSRGKIAHL